MYSYRDSRAQYRLPTDDGFMLPPDVRPTVKPVVAPSLEMNSMRSTLAALKAQIALLESQIPLALPVTQDVVRPPPRSPDRPAQYGGHSRFEAYDLRDQVKDHRYPPHQMNTRVPGYGYPGDAHIRPPGSNPLRRERGEYVHNGDRFEGYDPSRTGGGTYDDRRGYVHPGPAQGAHLGGHEGHTYEQYGGDYRSRPTGRGGTNTGGIRGRGRGRGRGIVQR
jgi:hypothetical protein